MRELLMIAVGTAFINNVVLSQFLGLCAFLGVSKKMDTAAGMGGAVIFVITISSFVTALIYKFLLLPLNVTYLQTIVFILVIAALVQFVEMFLKKSSPSLYNALGVYLPLITTNCGVLGVTMNNISDGLNYGDSLLTALGCGLGFFMAMRAARMTVEITASCTASRTPWATMSRRKYSLMQHISITSTSTMAMIRGKATPRWSFKICRSLFISSTPRFSRLHPPAG